MRHRDLIKPGQTPVAETRGRLRLFLKYPLAMGAFLFPMLLQALGAALAIVDWRSPSTAHAEASSWVIRVGAGP